MQDKELDNANEIMDNLDVVIQELEYLLVQAKASMDHALWDLRQEEIREKIRTILQQ